MARYMARYMAKTPTILPVLACLAIGIAVPAKTMAAEAPIHADGPAEDAHEAIHQYGQFVGTWSCQSSNRNQEGEWQDRPGRSTWSWYWVLGGYAVQDVFQGPEQPDGTVPRPGTNLRIYDEEAGAWHMVWTTGTLQRFQSFDATEVDGDIVMRGEVPAGGGRAAHLAKITFYDIRSDRFSWRYEAAGLQTPDQWGEYSRIECERAPTMEGRAWRPDHG